MFRKKIGYDDDDMVLDLEQIR